MMFNRILPFLLLVFLGFGFADDNSPRERYLHVSTNPSGADLYVGDTHPDFSTEPDYHTPAFVSVPLDKDQILFTLFRKEFKDTSINVTLSPKDTSFLIVALQPIFKENLLQEQQEQLDQRSKKSLGRRLMITSLVPLVIGGIASGITAYEISKANHCKSNIENSLITTGKQYQQNKKDFKEYRENARAAKTASIISLIAGGAIFSIGLILSF